MVSKGVQMEPNGGQMIQKVLKGYETKMDAKGFQMEPNGVQMERQGPKNIQKRHPEAAPMYIKTQKCVSFFIVAFSYSATQVYRLELLPPTSRTRVTEY